MKKILVYIVLMPISYALLLWLGYTNLVQQSPQEQWMEQAAPWLGEAPADMKVHEVNDSPDSLPYTVFQVSASDDMKERFYRAFPGASTNSEYLQDLPEWSKCGLTGGNTVIVPSMKEDPHLGLLYIVINNPNAKKQQGTAKTIQPLYPQYLNHHPYLTMWRDLLIGLVSYVFPALFCCIGRLWIERKAVWTIDTIGICMVIPALTIAITGYIAITNFGMYDGIMSIMGLCFFSGLNIACSLVLMVVTCIVRLFKAEISHEQKQSA